MVNQATTWVRAHPIAFGFLVAILVFGGVLRFAYLGSLMHFSGDEARDAFLVRSIARDGQVQLLGASTSIGNGEFRLGPAFLYLLVPGYLIAGESPVGGAWTVAILSFTSIFLAFLLGKRMVNTRAGIIAALLYSVSYLTVHYGRWQWNPNPAPFFILLVLLGMYALASANRKHVTVWVTVIGLCTGILMQLHATAIFALPPLLILLAWLLRIRLRWWQFCLGIGLVLLVQAPQIIYDLQHNFANLRGLWHIMQGSGTDAHSIFWRGRHTLVSFYRFFNEALLYQHLKVLVVFVTGLGLGVLGWQSVRQWRKPESNGRMLLLSWLLVPYVVYHAFTGVMFPHYFTIIFPVPFLIAAAGIDWLWQQKYARVLALPLVAIVASLALYQSSTSIRDLLPTGSRNTAYTITLHDLQDASAFIAQDAHSQPYQVFADPEPYTRSLQYLLDQAGTPAQDGAGLRYTFIRGREPNLTPYLGTAGTSVRQFGNYAIVTARAQ